jgi:rhodanese-related sulfurtransferase
MQIPSVIDAQMLSSLLEQGQRLKLIDVRSAAEFETAHIAGSYNVPVDLLPEHRAELLDVLRSPVVLVCQSGNRARQAEQMLREANLQQVHVLDGGMNSWLGANKSVIRGKQRWGLERQVRGVAGSLVVLGVLGSLLWQPLVWVAGFVGAGLAFSAATNTCAMAMMLNKLPYNRGATCDMPDVIARLSAQESA